MYPPEYRESLGCYARYRWGIDSRLRGSYNEIATAQTPIGGGGVVTKEQRS